MAFSLARWARQHDQRTRLADQLLEARRQLAHTRWQLGVERIALEIETEDHAATREHLRLMVEDNARLENECQLWRHYYQASAPSPPE